MRCNFGTAFTHALTVRGLSLSQVAQLAGVSRATVSAAARGKRVNVASAVRIAKVVGAHDVIPELEAWTAAPIGASATPQ